MKARLVVLSVFLILSGCIFSQIPILNSYPAITNKVVYLDFDGEIVSATGWNSGNTINALPSTLSIANIREIFQRVSEDFRPFDVNITTDSARFKNAPANRRMRVIITPTSAWYGSAGGVAYLNSFNNGGTPGTPCWVFENQLGYSAKNVAEACSHETGHTLSLSHQSTYSMTPSNTCTKTAEYNPGQGTGVTNWAPIMGVSYYKNVSTWYNGTNSQSCTTYQNDHGAVNPGITGPTYLSFLPDDVGNTYTTAKVLNLNALTVQDSGLITTPADIDVYKFTICSNRNVSFAVKPWALDTINYNGANLDVRFQLYDAANTLLLTDTSLTRLQTLTSTNLTPGSYYFTVDGGGSVNYSDYGSIGKYYIKIKATNPPALSNTIVTSAAICLNQSTTFSYTSNGTPTTWLWSVAGPSSTATYSVQNPILTPAVAGAYTLTLLATSSSSASCETTQTISVGALPSVSIATTPSSVCPGSNLQLTAGGNAASYVWLPGSAASATRIVSPLIATTYTVIGSNGLCSNSAVTTINVYPDFTPSLSATSTLVCSGFSLMLTASGGVGYSYSPNSATTSTAIVSPLVTTNYIAMVNDGVCVKQVNKLITVIPDFTVSVVSTPTLLCPNVPAVLSASNAVTYTFFPGGITTGTSIVISPSVTSNYTVIGSNGTCTHSTVKLVSVINDFTVNATGFNAIACAGQSVAVNLSGASLYTFNPGGFTGTSTVILPLQTSNYTIIGSDGYCVKSVVKTLTVNPDFNMQVVPSVNIFCPGQTVTLTASGATNYTTNPGGVTGNPAVISPTASSVYTITGSDGICSKTFVQSLTMSNDFNLMVSASDSVLCRGKVVTLNASGASVYTLNPGNIASNSAFLTPTVTTNYTVTGSDGTCKKYVTKLVRVSADFSVHISASDTVFCADQTVSLTASGAVNYTFNPGGLTTNPATVSPIVSTTYTITGTNADNCVNKATLALLFSECEYTGIKAIYTNEAVRIYPNPASDALTISADNSCSKIEIISITGSLVFAKIISETGALTVATGNWANGVYFVRAYVTDGNYSVQKIIVNH